MGRISNIIAMIRANAKCLFIKTFDRGNLNYNSFIRIGSDVSIRIESHSTIEFGYGLLISGRSVISSTDGGKLLLGKYVGVNCNSMIMCHESITIGDNTIMGPNVCVYDHDHEFNSIEGVQRCAYIHSPIRIGKNCWIGAGTIILRGTTIGDNCVVGAGCIVKGNYPDGSVIIQKREEIIKRR